MQDHLATVIEIAERNVADGGGPFAAIVVTADGRVFEGVNRVTRDNDPTAHAEIVAIRTACRELGTFALQGSVLYASCEPCPLCISAALWARLDAVHFAADRADAAAAGFDDAEFYATLAAPREQWAMPVVQHSSPDRLKPFTAWDAAADTRTDY